MSKGYQKHKERLDQVSFLGKALIRRAKKKCELCEARGVSMSVVEVEPVPSVPDIDHAVIICTSCQYILEQENPDANQARFLETAVWNETPAVQVTAVRLCQKLADDGVPWARELLETVYLSPEVEEWLEP